MNTIQRLGDKVINSLDMIPELLLIVAVGFVCIKIASYILKNTLKLSRMNKPLRNIVMAMAVASMWLVLLAIVFHVMGLTQMSLVLTGLIPLAASIGASSFVSDLIAGLFLAQDRDFNIGDNIKIADVEGVVVAMDARKIRLQDTKGKLHVYPNSSFDKSSWVVLSHDK